MNKLFLSIGLAWQSLRTNMMRSLLTVFGVMIGIGLVIIVMSAGEGVKGLVLSEVSSFGDNWINIEIKVPETGKNSTDNARALGGGVSITTLTLGDMDAIVSLRQVDTAYAGVTTQVTASYQNETLRPTVFAVSNAYEEITDVDFSEGRFYTEEENASASEVIVLGSQIKEDLFGLSDAVGNLVRIDGRGYRVVGVMESQGATGFIDMDTIVYIPVQTAQKKLMGIDHVMWIVADMVDGVDQESVAEEVRWLLRERHDISNPDKDDFAVTTMQEALEVVNTVVFGLTMLLIALSIISLVVGGVGIMNVMYVSVVERTFEIGLRKSVGATESDILRQFLVEAVLLTVTGGVIGITAGVCIAFLISIIASAIGFDWVFAVPISAILLSVGFSAAVGIFFGLYPAKQAANMDPIQALRQE